MSIEPVHTPTTGAMALLTPSSTKGKGLAFVREAAKKSPLPPKAKASMVQVKQVIRTGKALGKEVTDVMVNPDGSFRVSFADPSQPKKAFVNPWDEVLK